MIDISNLSVEDLVEVITTQLEEEEIFELIKEIDLTLDSSELTDSLCEYFNKKMEDMGYDEEE